MSSNAEELLSTAQRSRRAVWSDWRVAPPITSSDIRRWAIAVYWPDSPPARFLEGTEEASKAPDAVAPQEFNPFAWLPGGPPRTGAAEGVRRVLGGCRIRYGAPIRPGDVIHSRVRLDRWEPKKSRQGELLVVDYSHEWRNQTDDVVRDAVYTLILRRRSDAAG